MNNEKVVVSRYILKPTPTTWISIGLLFSIVPLGIVLPPWWAWENGPIESTQVVILMAGLIASSLIAWNSRNDEFGKVWMWTTPAWLLLVSRELSWGQVFFPIINDGLSEPKFIPLQKLWYGPYINFVMGIIVLAMIIGLWRSGKFKCFLKTVPISVIDLIIFVVGVVLSTVFDDGMIKSLADYKEMFEELSECIIFWPMFSMLLIMGSKKYNNNQSIRS